MALLVTYSQQAAIKKISANNQTLYNQIAAEVESLEIDKLLGSAFYQAVVADPGSYTDLLDAKEFTRADDTTITHKGLRYVIAYLNYSKYIGDSYVVDTFSGVRSKKMNDSEILPTGEIKRLQQEAREIAFNAFVLIREYLDLNTDTYTLWNADSDKKVKKSNWYGVKNTES